jgi:glycine cleavage system H protein
MPSPSDRKYTDSHEWVKSEGATLTLGVTQHAVDQLTDITYVEMKPAGTKVQAGGVIGEIESVKATSDIYSPVAGEIVEVNKALSDDPSAVNADPYGTGWLVKIKAADAGPLAKLKDGAAYDKAL